MAEVYKAVEPNNHVPHYTGKIKIRQKKIGGKVKTSTDYSQPARCARLRLPVPCVIIPHLKGLELFRV